MQKSFNLLTGLFLLGTAAISLFATDWLTGVYINQDKKSFMDEVIFCENGKAYAGMAPRKYEIVDKGDEKLIVLNSNGKFTFKISENKDELFPADKFTKDWFTTATLKLDPKRKDKCNW
ncbi:hypothetical protein CRV08_08350 [Halarcobacter ebronensis]|uniref:Uncharacterized protein n=1 Tax=Halarcobacter ebronensis TaxID=1462615 RepID=A0A4Q0YCX7_9BACT|nr:hypothetical protein [Halarcobacter ebronensis]RXJ68252.1 hypothetical protein CRV08_08350 [Halarcobacter ebronensis]